MGITNLLQLLSPITVDVHISKFAHKKIGIDAYCWLHKAVYSCGTELCLGQPTDKYLRYCLDRIRLLRSNDVIPVVIFDGSSLPMKGNVEHDRRRKRHENKERGLQLYNAGNHTAAREFFNRAVDVTPYMASKLIKVLRETGIECIVAPYEADAQLAFLRLSNFIQGIITEDSDLLAFGCHNVIFKMDASGNGKEVLMDKLCECTEPSFQNWTHEMFRHMCILSGCDYLDSMTGLGLKKAHSLLQKFRTLDRVFRTIKSGAVKSLVMPAGYEERFRMAELTFLHQRVWDPINQQLATVTPLPNDLDPKSIDFLGPLIPNEIAKKIANGVIDPTSKIPFEEIEKKELKKQAALDAEQQTPPNAASSAAPLSSSSTSSASLDESNSPSSEPSRSEPNNSWSTMRSRSLKRSNNALPVQKNKIPNYFTPVTRATQKPFQPPRPKGQKNNSQEESQSSEEASPDDDPEPASKKRSRTETDSGPSDDSVSPSALKKLRSPYLTPASEDENKEPQPQNINVVITSKFFSNNKSSSSSTTRNLSDDSAESSTLPCKSPLGTSMPSFSSPLLNNEKRLTQRVGQARTLTNSSSFSTSPILSTTHSAPSIIPAQSPQSSPVVTSPYFKRRDPTF